VTSSITVLQALICEKINVYDEKSQL